MTSPQAAPAIDLDTHRAALTGHCYRMLGSVVDAEDAVQETMLRAWRAMAKFDGRSSVATWMHRIATNVCLDALADRTPRVLAFDEMPRCATTDELTTRPRTHWMEPIPDVRAIPSTDDPHERAVMRENLRLAFVSALQALPPRQRAALILTQVLNWSAAEVAECLDLSTAAVNSALQRARATLEARRSNAPAGSSLTLDAAQLQLVDRFVKAFEAYDVPAITALLREDVVMCMPPYAFWLQGPADVAAWLSGRGMGCNGSVLVPTAACGAPAFAQYRLGGEEPWALIVLDLAGDRIGTMHYFLDTETLFPHFGMPMRLDR